MLVDGDASRMELTTEPDVSEPGSSFGHTLMIHFPETIFEGLIHPFGSIRVDHRNKFHSTF